MDRAGASAASPTPTSSLDGPGTIADGAGHRRHGAQPRSAEVLLSPAALVLAVGIVLVSLNAMRAGLLTRFMGALGIVVARLPGHPGRRRAAARADVLARRPGAAVPGRRPGGDPPAWRTGREEPWPSAARAGRGAQGRGRGEAAKAGRPSRRPPRSPSACPRARTRRPPSASASAAASTGAQSAARTGVTHPSTAVSHKGGEHGGDDSAPQGGAAADDHVRGVDWEAIERSPEFQELVTRRRVVRAAGDDLLPRLVPGVHPARGLRAGLHGLVGLRGPDRRLLPGADAVRDGVRARDHVPAQGRSRVRPARPARADEGRRRRRRVRPRGRGPLRAPRGRGDRGEATR